MQPDKPKYDNRKKLYPELEEQLKQRGVQPLLARMLSQRKIGDVETFLNPPQDAYLHLENLSLVKNIRGVSDLLADMAKNHKVASVIGDYDADGIVSSYMMKRICEILGVECNVFLPSRFEHGYGLNKETVGAFLYSTMLNNIPDVLFVLDCGSSSEKEVQDLKAHRNVNKIVVIDHHLIKEDAFSKSADLVASWCMSESQEMCACGLVYLVALDMFVAHGILTQENLQELLCLAAIGTIADMMPITKDNRIIVKQGLGFCDKLSSAGLTRLIQACKKGNKTITQSQVGFNLAPQLNAGGRLSTPQDAFDLLVSKDQEEITDLLAILDANNKNRKEIQRCMLEEAFPMIDEKEMKYGIFLFNPKWNTGVVGIAAQRLAEKFGRPAVVLGRVKGIPKGSGRSIEGISLIKILGMCQEMFAGYGGHDAAAGMSLKKNYLDKSLKMFNDACQKVFTEAGLEPGDNKKRYDAVLSPATVNEDTHKVVGSLYPYCRTNNPEPIFKLANASVSFVDKAVAQDGKKWNRLGFRVEGVDYKFSTFDDEVTECVNLCISLKKKANVYFKFSQNDTDKWGMQFDIVGVEAVEKLNNGTMPNIEGCQ